MLTFTKLYIHISNGHCSSQYYVYCYYNMIIISMFIAIKRNNYYITLIIINGVVSYSYG